MNFSPKSETEVLTRDLLSKGMYDFEIIEATERESKKGNQMIEIKVKIIDAAGKARHLTDYLLEKTPKKLRHVAEACGVLDKYEQGSLSGGDLKGKRGKAEIVIEKDKARLYPDKNVIADYLPAFGHGARKAS